MKNALSLLFFALIFTISAVAEAPKGKVRHTMSKAFKAYQDLQPFLLSENDFLKKENDTLIRALLNDLSTSFHSVSSFNEGFVKKARFQSRLVALEELLNDAHDSFKIGEKPWSLMRLKAMSTNCVGCHTNYEVDIGLGSVVKNLDKYDSYAQGEFYLISRQYKKASEAFAISIKTRKSVDKKMDAMRKWIYVSTRFSQDPKTAHSKLKGFLKSSKLPDYENEIVTEWLNSLERWSREKANDNDVNKLQKAESLLRAGIETKEPLGTSTSEVELLRAVSLLHELLEENKITNDSDQARTLYLLGYAYAKLPLFFVNELPDVFLEQCIRSHPFSDQAKLSYRLYEDLLFNYYAGLGESPLNLELRKELSELRNLAFGTQET